MLRPYIKHLLHPDACGTASGREWLITSAAQGKDPPTAELSDVAKKMPSELGNVGSWDRDQGMMNMDETDETGL